jgi:hypothetical protein
MFVLMLTLIYCCHFLVGVLLADWMRLLFLRFPLVRLATRSLPHYVLSCVVLLSYLSRGVWRMLLCVVSGDDPLT